MDNQIYHEQEFELDIKELFWDILSQWKAVLAVSLITAVLACGAVYHKDNTNYKAAVEAQKEKAFQETLPKDEQIANVVNMLPSDAIGDVWLVVQEKEWIEKQKKYLAESLLMKTDPADQRELVLVYLLNTENEDDLPVLLQAYTAFVYSEETVEAIGTAIGSRADNIYIGELIRSTEEQTYSGEEDIIGKGNAFTVKIVLPDETYAENVADAVTNALQEQGQRLNKQFVHSLGLVEHDVNIIYDRKTIKDRKVLFESIRDLEGSVSNTEKILTVEQKAAIESILSIISEPYNVSEEAVQPEAAEELAAPGLSKKYAILGFILGAFLYVFGYVAILILRGRVSAASGIERYTKHRLIGEVYYVGKRNGLSKLTHSNIIDKLHYKGLPDFKTQIDRIKESVEAVCMHTQAKDVTFIKVTDTNSIETVREVIPSIINATGNRDRNSNVLEVLSDVEEKNLLDIEDAILIIGDDTKVSHLRKVASLCRDYDINLLGSIYFSEM